MSEREKLKSLAHFFVIFLFDLIFYTSGFVFCLLCLFLPFWGFDGVLSSCNIFGFNLFNALDFSLFSMPVIISAAKEGDIYSTRRFQDLRNFTHNSNCSTHFCAVYVFSFSLDFL